MIVEAIVSAIAALINALAGLFPSGSVPSWFTSASGSLADLLGQISSVGTWVPTTLMVSVLGAILASYVIGFGVKVTRVVASFLTAGGGSAG